MSEQPSVIKQAEDVVNKVATSVAETLNLGKEETVGNPGVSILCVVEPGYSMGRDD